MSAGTRRSLFRALKLPYSNGYMVGLASFWPKALFLLVALGIGTGVYQSWRDVIRRNAPFTAKLMGITIFVAVWTVAVVHVFVREAVFHYELRQIRPEEVENFEIGNNVIIDPSAVSNIVLALNHAEWFAVNHGGWGEEIPFTIRLKSGRHRTYHVAQYLRQPGAVLISMSHYDSNGKGVGWNNGVVFCAELPATLRNADVSLPGVTPPSAPKEETTSPGWPAKLLPMAIFGFFTSVSLSAFCGITFGQMEVHAQSGQGVILTKWIGKIVGLPIVTIIAAGAGLRVMNTLLGWPDPTNTALIIGVWLALLSTGIIILALRFLKGRVHHT